LIATLAASRPPAERYGGLDARACTRALLQRRIPFTPVARAEGVDAPIRLTGRVHGVDFHGAPGASRSASPHEIVDCRLALALDDFGAILAEHAVVEGVHMSIYRPPVGPLPAGKTRRGQHEAGLAVDLGVLVQRDGTRLVIEDDWHGALGARPCGAGTGPWPPTLRAQTLRSILCSAVDAKLFNVVLTPNHDEPHRNHFHLEVTRGVDWFIVE